MGGEAKLACKRVGIEAATSFPDYTPKVSHLPGDIAAMGAVPPDPQSDLPAEAMNGCLISQEKRNRMCRESK